MHKVLKGLLDCVNRIVAMVESWAVSGVHEVGGGWLTTSPLADGARNRPDPKIAVGTKGESSLGAEQDLILRLLILLVEQVYYVLSRLCENETESRSRFAIQASTKVGSER